jgi:hypothetical protein
LCLETAAKCLNSEGRVGREREREEGNCAETCLRAQTAVIRSWRSVRAPGKARCWKCMDV